jgi:hypothetical protein
MVEGSSGPAEADHRPPNPPWKQLVGADPSIGCFSFYLSDELSRLPVRGVTLPANNKADPNIETGTFGLFSTCERQMRTSVVNRGLRYLLFVTRWGAGRVLTGYYRVGWYSEGAFGGERTDYALAADALRFTDPIPLEELPLSVKGVATSSWRTFRLLDPDQTEALVGLIEASPDRTIDYINEITRLERFNLHHTGFRCWQRTQPFDWTAAAEYLRPDPDRQWTTSTTIPNTSPTNHWRCEACQAIIMNKALLKACPSCEVMGALRPAMPSEIPTVD